MIIDCIDFSIKNETNLTSESFEEVFIKIPECYYGYDEFYELFYI